jgi:hypothetical protein
MRCVSKHTLPRFDLIVLMGWSSLFQLTRLYVLSSFKDMLYVRYVHLTKANHIQGDKPIFSSERTLYRGYARKSSIGKKNAARESQGAWRQDELIGGKPPVVK